jgi:mRNA-degrading endonuclease toxin of MazEF toxin-antitoxin module
VTRDEAIPRLDNIVVATVPKAQLTEAITELGPKRIDELCRALAAASGC